MIQVTFWFWSVWYYFRSVLWHIPEPLLVRHVSELPDLLDNRYTYVVGENGYLWFVALKCPCGCESTICLNLIEDAKPCWKIDSNEKGTITLRPSIWSQKGCGSHYFLRNGIIKWCIDNEDF